MKNLFTFSLLSILSFLSLHAVSSAHKDKQIGFQGDKSLLSQESLLTPFPMRLKSDPPTETINASSFNNSKVTATLTADKEFIKDGGSVKIMAELQGISWLNVKR